MIFKQKDSVDEQLRDLEQAEQHFRSGMSAIQQLSSSLQNTLMWYSAISIVQH